MYRLPIHAPDGQSVHFRLDMANVQEALEAARCTPLTEYFTLNANNALARTLPYVQIPKYFVWKADQKEWKVRQRGGHKVLSRIYHIGPQMGELFFIRLLLLHVRGARSFDELKTVNGVVCESFCEACIQLELVDDDRIWLATLNEVITYQLPAQL
jgi:ATP-dependent DNA helicase PIF1